MATGRPGWLGGGGGFLNGVDGMISGYRFLVEQSKKGEAWTKFELSVKQDGAAEPTMLRPWLVGSPDEFALTEGNDKTITIADGARISGKSELGVFIGSLLDQQFTRFAESETSVNLEAMIGTRCRFEQVLDERRKAKGEKRKDAKTGREYDYTNLVVSKIYAMPAVSKASSVAAHAPAEDVTALAKETLLKVLAKKSPVGEAQLQLLGNQTIGVQHPQRVAVVGLMRTPAFLAQMAAEGSIGYDAAANTLTLAG